MRAFRWSPRRAGRERGSATVELVGLLPWLLLLALAVWEIMLVAYTATAAENAALTGSRAHGKGENGEEAAMQSLSSWLRDGAIVDLDGDRATVTVEVPLIVPRVTVDDLSVTKSAELPSG
jgi:Flp pilus assembly protein TadG